MNFDFSIFSMFVFFLYVPANVGKSYFIREYLSKTRVKYSESLGEKVINMPGQRTILRSKTIVMAHLGMVGKKSVLSMPCYHCC